MSPRTLLVAALCASAASAGRVCVHPARGETRRISLDEVARAQEGVGRIFALAAERAARLSPDAPFDSGLPACRGRGIRLVRGEFAKELAGKSIAFAPAGRMPAADVRVATSARSLAAAEADALADRALAERLSVRCWPTLVRIRSEAELELLEGP
jgi:hypothetical protein